MLQKNVDEMVVTGEVKAADKFWTGFGEVFKFGTVENGPDNLKFYGMNIIPNEYFTRSINADDTLQALEHYPITWSTRRECDSPLTETEKSVFFLSSHH